MRLGSGSDGTTGPAGLDGEVTVDRSVLIGRLPVEMVSNVILPYRAGPADAQAWPTSMCANPVRVTPAPSSRALTVFLLSCTEDCSSSTLFL